MSSEPEALASEGASLPASPNYDLEGLDETTLRRITPQMRVYQLAVEKVFPYKGNVEKTEYRAITLPQLQRVVEHLESHCHIWRDLAPPHISATSGQTLARDFVNLYHVNDWLIKPATLTSNCAFVECLTCRRQKPRWYCSHWWGEPVVKFVACVEQHMELRGLHVDTPFWVCAYANRQHSLDAEIAVDPRQTSFFKAMQLAEGVLLILDGKTETTGPATPFTRIWCAFEQYVALEYYNNEGMPPTLLDIATLHAGDAHFLTNGATYQDSLKQPHDPDYGKAQRESSFPLEVIRKGLTLQLERAQASEEKDRVHILNCIAGQQLELEPLEHHANYEKANKRLHSFFAEVAFRQAADKGMIEELDLIDALSADTWRDSLSLDFSCCSSQVNDKCAELLAKAMPPHLKSLSLTFAYCESLTSEGVEAIARKLPFGLRELVLDLTGCHEVGDAAVGALYRHRPPDLQTNQSMAVFKGTGVKNFNTLWDFSDENLESTWYQNDSASGSPKGRESTSCSTARPSTPTSPSSPTGPTGMLLRRPTSANSKDLRDRCSPKAEALHGRVESPSSPTLPRTFSSSSTLHSADTTADFMAESLSPTSPGRSTGSRTVAWARTPPSTPFTLPALNKFEVSKQRRAAAFMDRLEQNEIRADQALAAWQRKFKAPRTRSVMPSTVKLPLETEAFDEELLGRADKLTQTLSRLTMTKSSSTSALASSLGPINEQPRRRQGSPAPLSPVSGAMSVPLSGARRTLQRRIAMEASRST